MRQRRIDNSQGIFLMWWNWMLSTGLTIALIVLSLWIRPIYLPFVAWGLDIILFIRIKRNRKAKVPACYLLPFICSRVLFWSGVIMVCINLLYSHWFIHHVAFLGPVNRQIPFVTQLIVAPTTLAVSLWTQLKGNKLSFCRDCKIRYGTPAERGFLGQLFTQEGTFQNRFLTVVALISTIVTWTYYFATYINTELNNMDKFFFVWMTVILYVATSVYSVFRYLGLWSYYCHKEENLSDQRVAMTRLRYILICENQIGIGLPQWDQNSRIEPDIKLDTPVQCNLPYRKNVTNYEAVAQFRDITELTGVDVRFMYANLNTNADCNIFHYLCFLDASQKESIDIDYEGLKWYSFNEVAGLINRHEVSPLFAAEIIRLHTIAMAWKTYDENGLRKYKIKHYKPTFRLVDLPKFNIDYNDPRWLYISQNNEDSPFFKLRSFWRKYVNGIDSD